MRRLSLVILAMFLLSVSAAFAQSETATQPTQQQEVEPATNGAAANPYQPESADQVPAAPAEDPAQATEPNALPETASDLPLLAGLGLLALAGVIIVRSGLKKST